MLLVAILHFVADADDPGRIAAALMAAVPPGSCLVISHLSADHYGRRARPPPSTRRRRRDCTCGPGGGGGLFGGLPLVPPGELVWSSQWHPDAGTPPVDSPGGASLWCGIARKP